MKPEHAQETLSDTKLYELALTDKHHQENRRDTINSYYISLFSAIIALIPFIERITNSSGMINRHPNYIAKLPLLLLCMIGLLLSRTWALNLKRILYHVIATDKYLIDMEKKYNKSFVGYVTKNLDQGPAPAKVTKNQFLLPYSFIVIFGFSIIYFMISIKA